MWPIRSSSRALRCASRRALGHRNWPDTVLAELQKWAPFVALFAPLWHPFGSSLVCLWRRVCARRTLLRCLTVSASVSISVARSRSDADSQQLPAGRPKWRISSTSAPLGALGPLPAGGQSRGGSPAAGALRVCALGEAVAKFRRLVPVWDSAIQLEVRGDLPGGSWASQEVQRRSPVGVCPRRRATYRVKKARVGASSWAQEHRSKHEWRPPKLIRARQ